MAADNNSSSNEALVLWLSQTNENHAADIQARLQARVFHNSDECVDYMTDFNDIKFLMIISSDNAQQVVSGIHTCEQLKAIYVLNSKEDMNEDWTYEYGKVKGIFKSVDQLSAKLSYDHRISDEKISFDTLTSTNNRGLPNGITSDIVTTLSNSHNIKFMYFHILIDILLKMSNNVDFSSKQDLVDHLKLKYSEREEERKIIDEFDHNYKPADAIRWYTKDTFLYGLLNKSLRESDFDTLFALRFFITDLYKQMILEHEHFRNNYLINNNNTYLSVYRGQSISNEELNILRQKVDGYFSMQSFLSASTDHDIAHIFSGAGTANTNTNQTWILFEFKIDTNLNNTKPYAGIKHLSQIKDEEEVLLALGSVFRVNSIEFDRDNQRWHAVLSLCDNENFDLYGIMRQYAAEIVADRVSPGFLLYQQGEYRKATQYFQKMLTLACLKQNEKAHCYRGLGTVAAEENKYSEGYKNFNREFSIWKRLDDEENCVEAYKNIGNMLFYMGKYKQALEYLQNAGMYFRANNYVMEYPRVYGMIAHIMGAGQQWEECLLCYEVQLEARERILEPNHEDIGITHANIGLTYYTMKKYKEAIDHLKKALDIYTHSYQTDHPNVLKAEEILRNATRLLNEG